ncbi:MAG: hypothetical protein LBC64_01345 [Fibromonadaceae bacterium]|jgi:mannosyltransferase OCH1-like enzyme|nr:hypothetical protein [Fibromonadaceae bacterium]
MIPKIIHYIWLGKNIPQNVQNNIEAWKNLLPFYEIIRWDLNKFDVEKSEWVKNALKKELYAFAADYIRFYVLYNFGGIYLDTDVSIVKSFDELLDLPYFTGFDMSGKIESATIGAESKCEWIKKCLDYYNEREFSTTPLNIIMREVFLEYYGITKIKNKEQFNKNEKQMQIFSADFFSPKHWNYKKIYKTKNTFSIHHSAGSWLPKFSYKDKVKNFLRTRWEIWKTLNS